MKNILAHAEPFRTHQPRNRRPIDLEHFKRKSWSGFSAEFARIPGPALYDFTVRGSSAHLMLFDLYRTDGVTVVGADAQPLATKNLRNKMVFAPPGCPIDGWCALEKPASITTVAICPDVSLELGVKLDSIPARLGFEDELLRSGMLRFQALLANPSSGQSCYAEAIVELMVFDLARVCRAASASEVAIGALDPQQVQMVVDYIDSHLSGRPRISELAELLNLTRFHFMRSFKLAVGVPPHQFVIARRIERAKELLLESSHSIASVAAETGFGTSIQLARAFRRAIGTTPSEYRRHTM